MAFLRCNQSAAGAARDKLAVTLPDLHGRHGPRLKGVKNGVRGPSRCGAVVLVQESAQSVAAFDRAGG